MQLYNGMCEKLKCALPSVADVRVDTVGHMDFEVPMAMISEFFVSSSLFRFCLLFAWYFCCYGMSHLDVEEWSQPYIFCWMYQPNESLEGRWNVNVNENMFQ